MWGAFHVQVPGKWVLTGEHSVLKGASAIALPHPEFHLELTFQPQIWSKDEPHLKVLPDRAAGVVEQILSRLEEFKGDRSKARLAQPSGSLVIESSIPVGAGLGSSAALCVAMTRWAADPLGILEPEIIELARSLEDQFHGRSSGMDVAATAAGEAILFSMAEGPKRLGIRHLPKFSFHDTGLRARTSDCVAQVEAFRSVDVKRAELFDSQMSSASIQALEALRSFDDATESNSPVRRSQALKSIAESMHSARQCFQAWGLVPPSVEGLEQELRAQGALATKLTGAGGGGFVVALWES